MRVARRHWRIIAITVVVVTVATFAFGAMRPTRYRATSTVIYQGDIPVNSSLTMEVLRVGTLVSSPGFVQRVYKDLHVPVPPTATWVFRSDFPIT